MANFHIPIINCPNLSIFNTLLLKRFYFMMKFLPISLLGMFFIFQAIFTLYRIFMWMIRGVCFRCFLSFPFGRRIGCILAYLVGYRMNYSFVLENLYFYNACLIKITKNLLILLVLI